jgi:hypothetical protein
MIRRRRFQTVEFEQFARALADRHDDRAGLEVASSSGNASCAAPGRVIEGARGGRAPVLLPSAVLARSRSSCIGSRHYAPRGCAASWPA